MPRFIEDLFSGLTGVRNVAVDFGLKRAGQPWLITSGEFASVNGGQSGPHFAPFSSFRGNEYVSMDLMGALDGNKLFRDLMAVVADSSIRHAGVRQALHFAAGYSSPRFVNCSSMIGRAVCNQPQSRFAVALRQALRSRLTYGEVTPGDLARAAYRAGLLPSPGFAGATPVGIRSAIWR